MKRTFSVKAIWDDKAKIFYSESDIIGLHIEASSVEEFEEILSECAVELILENHISAEELANRSFKDLVPAILWQRPEQPLAAA